MTKKTKFKCTTCGKITRNEGHMFTTYLGGGETLRRCYDCVYPEWRDDAINSQHEEALRDDKARQTIINEIAYLQDAVIQISDQLRSENEQGIDLNYETLRLKKILDHQAFVLDMALREWKVLMGDRKLRLMRDAVDCKKHELMPQIFYIPADVYLSDEVIMCEASIHAYGFLSDVANSFSI